VVRQTDRVTIGSVAVWRTLHPALKRHALRLLASDLLANGIPLEDVHVSRLCDVLERDDEIRLTDQLPYGLSLGVSGSTFSLEIGAAATPERPEPQTLQVPGTIVWDGGELSVRQLQTHDADERARLLEVCGPGHAICDADVVGPSVLVRPRHSGDKMRPFGMAGSRTLQDLMVDRHIPRARREQLPVLLAGNQIVWVPGVALDARAAVTPRTHTAVHLCFSPRVQR
jgi:tRNA(Ile)-lysidine synthase